MLITKVSPISGNKNSFELDITGEEMLAWKQGTLIQDAFPRLSPEEREFLKTGITSEEWDKMFGGD